MTTVLDTIHDKITKVFIEDNPRDIVLRRNKKETTQAGGFRLTPLALLLPQLGRLVQNRNLSGVNRTLPEGRIVSAQSVIVFLRDADVERYDTCTIDEDNYLVTEVVRLPWSTQADVVQQ